MRFCLTKGMIEISVFIRPYEARDYDRVRLICIATSDTKIRSESKRTFILKMYCDYYIESEPKNCFVAVDGGADGAEEQVVGYILCAADCESYAKNFLKNYVPKIKATGRLNGFTARSEVFLYSRYAAFFPAHLHIDVLPAYQRLGIGKMLTDTLLEHLREMKIKGVMLVVGKKNVKGRSFYYKYGFSEVGKAGPGVVFGIDL